MARKIALLIGVDDYGAGLNSLRCPTNGAAAMRSVLKNPDIGGFDEVITLFNPDVGEMRSRISEIFVKLKKRDLVLFYFTGHGLKDMTGDFYLTTSQTELFSNGRPNAGTAVEAHFLKRELAGCMAERKVVILDCCFGAAFANGFLTMSDDNIDIDIEAQLGGKGWCILTASTSSKYALEQKGNSLSVYTRYLVEGLKTGGAAPDGQDFISAQNLHEYVKTQIEVAAPAMEPTIFNGQQGYNIVIASIQLDNEQRYRKQVQTKIRDGMIGPAGFAVLGQWQKRLGLSSAAAKAIEDEILQPYRERQKHLALYTKALEAEKRAAYPLDEVAIRDLKDLQRLLSLCDDDVKKAEAYVLGRKDKSSQPIKLLTEQNKQRTDQKIEPKIDQKAATVEINVIAPKTNKDSNRKSVRKSSRKSIPPNTHKQNTHRQNTTHKRESSQPRETSQKPLSKDVNRKRESFDRSNRASPKDAQSKNNSGSAKRWVRPTRLDLKASKPLIPPEWDSASSVKNIRLESIQFSTVHVNPVGKVVRQSRHEATTFVEQLSDRISMTMVHIPGGKFVMGAAKGEKEANDNEYPQREWSIPDFWMGQCSVTQAQWKALMGPKVIEKRQTAQSTNPAPDPAADQTTGQIKRPLQPIDHVFWTEAVAFCHQLSKQTGRDYRLPSSPQWEYACRARSTTPFHFGETITPALANYNGHYSYGRGGKGQYREQTTEVGSFPPNAFGLYDMHGNVWEWCLDGWHTFDPNGSADDNIRRLSGQKKSLRGGSWFYLPANCRSAYRLTYPFHSRTDDIGFRVICSSPVKS